MIGFGEYFSGSNIYSCINSSVCLNVLREELKLTPHVHALITFLNKLKIGSDGCPCSYHPDRVRRIVPARSKLEVATHRDSWLDPAKDQPQ